MRAISAPNLAALQARHLVARDFLWIVARDRDTGDPVTDGMWSDVGNVTALVLNPDTGVADSRAFFGSGTLVQISAISLVSNVTIQTVTITMSQVAERVNQLVRTYDCKQARVEVYRGLFDPDTRNLVAPAVCRFVGFLDESPIVTPAENEEGAVTFNCKSHSQELTRSNPDTRALESQKLRNATDDFHKDTPVVGEWEHFWGKHSGKVGVGGSQGSSNNTGGSGSIMDMFR